LKKIESIILRFNYESNMSRFDYPDIRLRGIKKPNENSSGFLFEIKVAYFSRGAIPLFFSGIPASAGGGSTFPLMYNVFVPVLSFEAF
jgi:hypothetical protein